MDNLLLGIGLSCGILATAFRYNYERAIRDSVQFATVKPCSTIAEALKLGDGAYVLFNGETTTEVTSQKKF